MQKYGPTLKNKVLIEGVTVAEDVKITLPEVTFQTAEIRAMGTLNLPICLTDHLEAGVTYIGCDKGFYRALGLKKTKFEYRWVENKLLNSGEQKQFACKAFITGVAQNVPGGDIEPGTAFEGNITIAVQRYQKYVEGQETVLIDKLNGICRINGKDYAQEINNLI